MHILLNYVPGKYEINARDISLPNISPCNPSTAWVRSWLTVTYRAVTSPL